MSVDTRGRKQRWYWYSVDAAPSGGTGPFGPIEASTFADARSIASERARNAGLRLDGVVAAHRVEPWPPLSGAELRRAKQIIRAEDVLTTSRRDRGGWSR